MAPADIAPETVAEVVAAVQQGAKYASVDAALIAALASQELAKGRKPKDAIKEVKSRLHQSVAAYHAGRPDFAAWRERLAQSTGDEPLRAACREVMAMHHSTRERLPSLDTFYATVLGDLSGVRVVLDLGCGLNPLALPWMGLPATTTYLACDVDHAQMALLGWWLDLQQQPGRAFVCNLLDGAPHTEDPVDVALLLKIVPCLEQQDRRLAERLLDQLAARVLVISFPAQSLGGRRKGMVDTYARRMDELLAGRPWRVERFDFPSEVVFRVFTEQAHE